LENRGTINSHPRGCLQIRSFAPEARNPALLAKGVYSSRTRPEKKGPDDAANGQKNSLETAPKCTFFDLVYILSMKLATEQFEHIAVLLAQQRGNVSQDNINCITAILYVAEHGCKWRWIHRELGNWHTVYTRMNRWSKN